MGATTPAEQRDIQDVLMNDADGSAVHELGLRLAAMAQKFDREARVNPNMEIRQNAVKLSEACRLADRIVQSTALKFSRSR